VVIIYKGDSEDDSDKGKQQASKGEERDPGLREEEATMGKNVGMETDFEEKRVTLTSPMPKNEAKHDDSHL
jgi:hypothetical protein